MAAWTPREMLGPKRPRLVLGHNFPFHRVPKFPGAVATRRRQRLAVGTPRQRVAAVGVSLLEKMDRAALRRIVNRHLARDRSRRQPAAVRRPRHTRDEIIQPSMPDEVDGPKLGVHVHSKKAYGEIRVRQ
jgi:hypothetical protein